MSTVATSGARGLGRVPGIVVIAAALLACGGCAGPAQSLAAQPPAWFANGATQEDAAAFAAAVRARLDAQQALDARLAAEPSRLELAPRTPVAATPPALDDLRSRIPADRALLFYRMAEPHASVWVVTREGWRRFELPGAGAIESMADTLHHMLARRDEADSDAARHAARRLYMMLVASAEPLLREKRELVIVPDGALWLLPFEALLAMELNLKGEVPKHGYLIEHWDVAYAMSAEAAAAPAAGPLLGGVVALGAPLFKGPGAQRQGPILDALPNSALELSVLDQEARGRARSALVGNDATRDALLGEPLLADAALVHLASHAVAVDEEPARSGLWLAADSTGGPGFLSVRDIMALDLRAQLVALTQCETSEVGPSAGRGVRALAGAVLGTGAREVLLSLWKPLDRTSGLLLGRFYRDLLRKGRPASAALAAAKRQMLKKSETRSPFLWAQYVLIEGAEAGR